MLQTVTSRPRRILMTLDAVGGVWRYAIDLGRALAREGNGIVFAGLGPEPSGTQRREAEAVGPLAWLATPPDWMAAREEELDGLAAELAGLVEDYAVDLVHLNAPSQACGVDLPCPVVVVSHSCVTSWFRAVRGEALPSGWAWHEKRNRAGFDRADAVVVPSLSHAAMLEACYGPIAGLGVVHNSVSGRFPRPPRKDFVFAAARWWDEGKNATVLDEAARSCRWPVLVAGPLAGPNGETAHFSRARSVGVRTNAEVRMIMGWAGVFVSPSLYEPFGLSVLEAAHAGAALVLADIPTHRELWDDAALFFPPRDAGALAHALDRVAADAPFRRLLGEAAERRAAEYSPERQVAGMLGVYEKAAAAALTGR